MYFEHQLYHEFAGEKPIGRLNRGKLLRHIDETLDVILLQVFERHSAHACQVDVLTESGKIGKGHSKENL